MQTSLIQCFVRTVKLYPNYIAVSNGEQAVTFIELWRQESKVAEWLAEEYGADRRPIAVFLPKCFWVITADLAIVHAGNAYMNMDIKTPPERLANVLNQAKPLCIITNENYLGIIEPKASDIPNHLT